MLMNKTSIWLLVLCMVLSINLSLASSKSPSKTLSIDKRWYQTTTITTDCDTITPTPTPTPAMYTKPAPHHGSDGQVPTITVIYPPCLPTPPKYETQVIVAAALLMAIGVYLMAVGFPFFRVTMSLIGLLLGAAITWISLHAAEPKTGYPSPSPSTFYLGCSLGGGLFMAVFSLFFWKVALYFLCGMAGYLLSLFIWTWKEDFILQNILARNIIGLGLGSLFILGFVLIEYATILLSLNLIGAYIFILGLDFFMKTGFIIGVRNIMYFDNHQVDKNVYVDAPVNPATIDWANAKYTIDTKVYGMLFGILGLWIVATFWQRWYNRGVRFGLRVVENTNNTLFVEEIKKKPEQ